MRIILIIIALGLGFTTGAFGAEAKSVGTEMTGQFWRLHWYERGKEHANPAYESQFRVNSPEVVLPGPCLIVRSKKEANP